MHEEILLKVALNTKDQSTNSAEGLNEKMKNHNLDGTI
jgi:hypothetical protein